jgi:membrane-associated phospholipid phosphatase
MRLAASLGFIMGLMFLSPAIPAKSPQDYATDVKDYALAPLHWDTQQRELAAGALALVAATYSLDNHARDHFAPMTPGVGDPHQWRDAAPAAALTLATLAVGKWQGDTEMTHAGIDMIEAMALGGISSTVLKSVAGRVRPNETADRANWRNNGTSFPSGHSTAAFAAAQVFADRMPREQWGWSVLGYGLAVATAYARVQDNVHWTSDVAAGAALGMATGRFVSNRDTDSTSRVALSVQPLDRGAMLMFSIHPR